MRFAVNAPPFAEPAELVELGVLAERAGWDAFLMWDHMVLDRKGMPIADPWVTLGAVAAKTERIRLGTCVTPLARRRPQKVARETVTLDRLSAGRLVLGVGLGHPAEEYTTFGEDADVHARAACTDEALTVLTGLWSGEPFEYDGKWFHVERVTFLPTPLQRPRLPVWIACALPSRRPIERAARWDGIVPIKVGAKGIEFLTPPEIHDIVDDIRHRRGTLDNFDVVVNAGPPPTASVTDFEAAGASWWLASMDYFPGWFDELRGIVEAGPPRG
jgi:alkanesulfonate monooxygenase SsuD/methylene tetrahydromethanopterin reductase-like flavin-dependent oxidoreductase (luciferase family)